MSDARKRALKALESIQGGADPTQEKWDERVARAAQAGEPADGTRITLVGGVVVNGSFHRLIDPSVVARRDSGSGGHRLRQIVFLTAPWAWF